MCLTGIFFNLLTLYFLLLLFITNARKLITYKGVFYVFTLFLSCFLGYLMFMFPTMIMYFGTSEFLLKFSALNWLGLDISISLKFDALSYLFVLLVTTIGCATNFYILNYLKYEAQEDVFALLINWFMFSMIILVLGNNLFTLFLGWESIGLSSFFLINFWSTRRGTVKSSFKAFFFNKISDVFLFLFLLLVNYLTFLNDLTNINIKFLVNVFNFSEYHSSAMFCLFFCTLFKSAQLFGHLWLPDSMEAPVPASALIHSATLVSAGIYLLLRFTPLVSLNHLQSVILLIGSLTAAYGGLVSASQTDMKKLLAYSTISHCGFLFITIGCEIYFAVVIYLFLHGLFKASTFFCAGSFIRVAGSQDTRQMGALSRLLPVDTVFLIICAFNLGGLPFSLGYLYKNVLIACVLNYSSNFLILGFSTVGLLCSLIYVYRLVYYSAFDTAKEFFLSIIYELQQKSINVVERWSLTSYVQIIAILIILFFALWIYVYFVTFFLNSGLTLDHMPISFNINTQFLQNSNYLYKSYYELFYSMYFLIAAVLGVLNWKCDYTFSYRINFMVNSVIAIFFIIIYSIFLNLKCGVMFWQKRLHNKTLTLGFLPINQKF